MSRYLLLISVVGSASTEKVSHSAPRKLARERGRLVREQLFAELGV